MLGSPGIVPISFPFILAVCLIALGTVPGWGIHLALPLSALMVTAAIWSQRPLPLAWRWAGWGSAFWAVEELVWALARRVFETTFLNVTDPLYFAGLLCWFIAVFKMDHRAMPKLSLLVASPALLFIAWLLFQNFDTTLFTRFPLFDLALLVVAVPAIERSFYGDLPEGRLLWLLGLFGRALAGSLLIWLDDTTYTTQLLFFLWLFAYTFIALGAWIELTGRSGGLWPVAYGLLGLEAVTGVVIAITLVAYEDMPHRALVPGLFLGYLLFVGMMLLVIADRNRRVRAEQKLKQWTSLLQGLTSLPSNSDPKVALGALMNTLQRAFSDLVGISATSDNSIQSGDTGPYSFPVVAQGAEVGRLFFRAEPRDVTLLDAVAPSLASHFERTLSQLHWYNQSLTDPLTGLHNRRVFELQVLNLANLAYRHDQPICLAFLDIDHFKRINDHHGHSVGDEALKAVAKLLRRHIRGEDLAVRWGGEEFVLLLYSSDLPQAIQVVERVRSELRQQPMAAIAWPVTVSAGLAGGTVPGSEKDLYQWLAAADGALLEAKETGRDRLVVSSTAVESGSLEANDVMKEPRNNPFES